MQEVSAEQSSQETPPRPPPKLPVDKKWLVNLLNNKTGAKGVLSNHTCEIIAEGKGFLSEITRVSLDWDKSSEGVDKLPKGVIIKQPTIKKIEAFPVEQKMKDFFSPEYITTIHNHECSVYEFLNKHPPAPIPMAKCFHLEKANSDPDSGMIILEDLTDKVASLTFVQKASVDQVCEIAKYLGQLQAYGFNHSDMKDYIFPMPKDPMEMMISGIPAGFDAIQADYPEKIFFTFDHVNQLKKKITNDMNFCRNPSDYGLIPVLALGDLQPNNILWLQDEEGKPSSTVCAMIDFQLAHIGNCVFDLSMMILQCLSAKTRQDNQERILSTYYKALTDNFKGAPGEKCPVTRQEVDEQFRKTLCYTASMHMGAYPTFKQMGEMLGFKEADMVEFADSMVATFVELGIKDFA